MNRRIEHRYDMMRGQESGRPVPACLSRIFIECEYGSDFRACKRGAGIGERKLMLEQKNNHQHQRTKKSHRRLHSHSSMRKPADPAPMNNVLPHRFTFVNQHSLYFEHTCAREDSRVRGVLILPPSQKKAPTNCRGRCWFSGSYYCYLTSAIFFVAENCPTCRRVK